MAYQKDISAILGLSISTVSRALKGYPDISEETRKKVLRTAEELDYQSGRRKKAEGVRHSGAVGLMAPKFGDMMDTPYYREMLCGIAAEASRNERDLVVMGADSGRNHMSSIGKAANWKVDGICLLASKKDLYEGRFAELLKSRIPVVSIENYVAGYTTICNDRREDARLLLQYLKSKGHRKTAHIGDLSLESKKLASMLTEEAQRLKMSCMEIERGVSGQIPGGKEYFDTEGISCVIFENCKTAEKILETWENSGIRIPEDISAAVLQTGPQEHCTECREITCVTSCPQEIGEAAVRRLIMIAEHPESDSGEMMPVKGMIREGVTVKDFGGNCTRKI